MPSWVTRNRVATSSSHRNTAEPAPHSEPIEADFCVIGAGAAGLVLIAPVGLLRVRLADTILLLGALTGIAVAAGSFAALLISEYVPFFGFMESGYRLAIVLSLLFEGLAMLLLVVFVVALVLDRRSAGRARDVFRRPLGPPLSIRSRPVAEAQGDPR